MQLLSARVRLREILEQDLVDVHEIHSLKEVDEFNTLGIPAHTRATELIVKEWIAQQTLATRMAYTLAIECADSGKLIGMIGLKLGKANYRNAEVWFKIHKKYFNQGYTTEALPLLLTFGFGTLALHRIEAGFAKGNHASKRVLEKVGMLYEGTSRALLPIRGTWVDGLRYALFRQDYVTVIYQS
jgi:[ribosomal protein S5]-alanine N-acetyltransferase